MAKRMLIVDDALIMRRRIGDVARQSGWEVAAEAVDGEEAIAFYERDRPDLVTLDIVMPKMDGVAALKRVMAIDPEARIIIISAVNQREKLSECIAHGAIDFIVKPFDTARLKRFFEKYLAAEN